MKIDFLNASLNYRRKQQGFRHEAIARAVGIKGNFKPTIIDCTAGLGNDALMLASFGCQVQMLERHSAVAKALEQAMTEAQSHNELNDILAKMTLHHCDAQDFLQNLRPEQYPDVITLDPMFPERKKSALVKKTMRELAELVGDDPDADELFQLALQRVKRRVVVKRPKLAPPLAEQKPGAVIPGKACRFDVYLLG